MKATESALSPYRVLDLTQGGYLLCGKILADLGADVIKVEPPGGDRSRDIGPFYRDIPDPEKSLFWFAYNANKRGITLDIETRDGAEILKRLVKGADFVVESFSPGYLQELGLGYDALSGVNPRVILTSITPFGQSGPKANYKACDLTVWASGAMLYINGEPDRAPNWISFPQSELHAGAEGAAASMIAHWHRETTGEGQHVDVSAQQCVIWTTMNAVPYWDLNRRNCVRSGAFWTMPNGVRTRWIFPCKDGDVTYALRGGGAATHTVSTQALVRWMVEEGMVPKWLRERDWFSEYDAMKLTQEEVNRSEQAVIDFFMTKTRAELFKEATIRGILLADVKTCKDIQEDSQLRERSFWASVEHPELGETLTYCGPFLKMSETPPEVKHRAPLIGEHNQEVYERELGIPKDRLLLLKQARVI